MGEIKSPESTDPLILRLQRGDEQAIADLVRDHGPRIRQLALRYLGNAEDAEELAQDVLLKTVDRIADFRGDSTLSSWIHRVTFNAAVSRLRRLRVRAHVNVPSFGRADEPAAGLHEVADWSALADELALRRQMRRRLADALRRLPAIYRAPVLLRDVHGLTTGEASSALSVNDQTLKSRLHRGRRLLRTALADFADGLALHRA